MKKIYSVLFAVSTALLMAPAVLAQTVPYRINEEYGIAFNKYILPEQSSNGEYTIRIETFGTGGGEVRAIPSDIVLALDNSGSMLYNYYMPGVSYGDVMESAVGDQYLIRDNNPDYRWYYSNSYLDVAVKNGIGTSTPPRANGTWAPSFNSNAKRYYKHTDGKYYIIQKGGNATDGYYLYAAIGGGAYKYLVGDSIVDTRPAVADRPKNTRGAIYWGTDLYRPLTRMEKLLEGVEAFIREIGSNNDSMELDEGQVGNQVAIVSFGYPLNTSGAGAAGTFLVTDFTPVTQATAETVIGTLSAMNFWGDTSIGQGIEMAYGRLNNQMSNPAMDPFKKDSSGNYIHDSHNKPIVNRSKVVVIFTDGDPTSEPKYTPYTGSSTNSARARAIGFSNLIKAEGEGKINGRVFSIALGASTANANFLRHVSSDYSQSSISGDGPTYSPADPEKNKYYYDAGLADLTDVFQEIASIAGGSSEVNSSSLVNIDIVSKSFSLPAGVTAGSIKLYTAECIGILPQTYQDSEGHTHHYLAFAEPVEAGTRPAVGKIYISEPKKDPDTGEIIEGEFVWVPRENVLIDREIAATVTAAKNKVEVTGFNYGDYWCGLDADPTHDNTRQMSADDPNAGYAVDGYRGFKLIFDIPVVIEDGALGGPNVFTNEEGSGLYDPVNDKFLIEYPRPTLPIPVNLWIQKEGLKKGESATFTIERKLIERPEGATEDPAYEYYTTVLITGSPDNSPVIRKLQNLDPKYYYRIKESGWSWTYSNQKDDQGVLLTKDGQAATTENELENPIIIVNTPTPPDVKHAESVVTNVLSTKVTETSTTISSRITPTQSTTQTETP